jgi:hypothetical protein
MADTEHDRMAAQRPVIARRLDAAGWGLFFIWIGIALLAGLGWGMGLLGVGIIMLGRQVARKCLALTLEGFWVVVGFLFVVGGVWEYLSIRVGLVPILCILVGIALLVSALVGKTRD